MDKEEWHKRYKATIKEALGGWEATAEECLQAGMGNYDYEDNPEEAANMEMSYWDD